MSRCLLSLKVIWSVFCLNEENIPNREFVYLFVSLDFTLLCSAECGPRLPIGDFHSLLMKSIFLKQEATKKELFRSKEE